MKPVKKATAKRIRTGCTESTGETKSETVCTMPISRITVDMNRKPIVATNGVAIRETPFIMSSSACFGLACASIMVTMAAAIPTRKIGKPQIKPITYTRKGKNAFHEVVEYSRFSISCMIRAFSAASILMPRRRMSAVARIAESTKMEPAAIKPKTLKRP